MAERITVTLHELVSYLDGYADAYLRKHHGKTFSHFRLLATLAELGTSSVTELAECLVVSKAAVSKRIPELVEGDWIVTSGDPANARRVMLDLTPKAWQLVGDAGGVLNAAFDEVMDSVPGLDQDLFHAHLRTMVATLQAKGLPE
jgi:DNA-binding MarR family transcriptional regulator